MGRGTGPTPSRRCCVVLLAMVGWIACAPATVVAQDGSPEGPTDGARFEAGGEAAVGGASGAADGAREPGLRRTGTRPWQRGTAGPVEPRSLGRRYLETLGWLVLVVGLAIASIFALRRFVPGATHPQNRKLVRVIGRGAVGPKHQVVVTRIGERTLILGLTSDSIVRLGEVEDPVEAIRMTPPEVRFEDQVTLSEAVYREDDVRLGEHEEPDLEPYRREIDRLRGMVDIWKGSERDDVEPPGLADSGRVELDRAEPGRVELDRAEPGRAELGVVRSGRRRRGMA